MDELQHVKTSIEEMLNLSGSDADALWGWSGYCRKVAVAPALAAGVKWGPGLVGVGTVSVPGLGTMSGFTATVIMMGAVWGTSYAACMSLLPGLKKVRDDLHNNQSRLNTTRREIQALLKKNKASNSFSA